MRCQGPGDRPEPGWAAELGGAGRPGAARRARQGPQGRTSRVCGFCLANVELSLAERGGPCVGESSGISFCAASSQIHCGRSSLDVKPWGTGCCCEVPGDLQVVQCSNVLGIVCARRREERKRKLREAAETQKETGRAADAFDGACLWFSACPLWNAARSWLADSPIVAGRALTPISYHSWALTSYGAFPPPLFPLTVPEYSLSEDSRSPNFRMRTSEGTREQRSAGSA
jgi:hypothetical protein